MRIIVYGVGAIGGTVAAALALSGQKVLGIARGGMLEAIRAGGLRLRTPESDRVARLSCAADPVEAGLRPDDVVLLTMKTQDTLAALDRLAAAGLEDQPVFCLQNGVANERLALRRFPNVHGVTVMMPALYRVPGEVAAFSSPRHGIFDIGRFPRGTDPADEALAGALEAANIASFVTPEVMASKHGKLLMNLGNAIQAALDTHRVPPELSAPVRAEGIKVLEAAGIPWTDVMEADPRRDLMQQKPVPGVERVGGSTRQSLIRGAGTVETDYLNGEIVLLGRLHGVPVPLNSALMRLGRQLAARGEGPGGMSVDEMRAFLEEAAA